MVKIKRRLNMVKMKRRLNMVKIQKRSIGNGEDKKED